MKYSVNMETTGCSSVPLSFKEKTTAGPQIKRFSLQLGLYLMHVLLHFLYYLNIILMEFPLY